MLSNDLCSIIGHGTSYTDQDFQSYLEKSRTSIVTLDLSEASLMEVIDYYVAMKSRLSPKFSKGFSSIRYNLTRVEQAFRCTLLPHQVSEIFWHNFIPYLLNRGMALSSIQTICSQLKCALSWAARFGAKVSPTYDLVRVPSYNHEQISLTPDDVSHIYHFDLRNIKRRPQRKRVLQQIKDMFVLSCNLGQRHSDMVRIDKSCFTHNTFSIVQQKTGHRAKVDIDRMCIDRKTTYAILEKYDYEAPYKGDISHYNKGIKELLDIMGFHEEVKQDTKVNGHIRTDLIPKYKLVSSHTARRTFATTNVMKGTRISEIRRATGHRTEAAFDRYVCYWDND